jgi:biopolymer transport protein ExbD
MRFTPKRPTRGNFDIVVTSMLDINFLLVMFFMMTAHFQRSTHAALQLPQERGEERAKIDESGLVVNITAEGTIIVSGETISMDELRARVKSQIDSHPAHSSDPLKLMVRADRRARTADLNRIVKVLRELGVGTIRIATEIPI